MSAEIERMPPVPASRSLVLSRMAVLAAATGASGSLYLSLGMQLKACPLCFYERTFMLAAFAVLALGSWVERDRPGLTCLLAVPLAWGGLGVAAFHEYLVLAGTLECPLGLLGLGTAPAQSLAMFVLLAACCTAGAVAGQGESSRQGLPAIVGAAIVGAAFAFGCVKSSPTPPPAKAEDVDKPLDTCRRPYKPATD